MIIKVKWFLETFWFPIVSAVVAIVLGYVGYPFFAHRFHNAWWLAGYFVFVAFLFTAWVGVNVSKAERDWKHERTQLERINKTLEDMLHTLNLRQREMAKPKAKNPKDFDVN